MYEFGVTDTGKQSLLIESNTYWNCKSEGNFMLSKYDGSGSTTIDIIIPEDEMVATGVVYFSYGDDRCRYPEIEILYTNNCLIETTPSWKKCGENNRKTILFYYDEKGEVFNVSVSCIGNWEVLSSELKYLISNNNITIFSNGENNSILIKPTGDKCSIENYVEVRLIKNPD